MLGNNERRKRIKVKRIEKFTNKIVDQKKERIAQKYAGRRLKLSVSQCKVTCKGFK